MNEKRYVLVQVPDLDEYAGGIGAGDDRRARINILGLREIASADVVLAVGPTGAAVVVKDRDVPDAERGAATVTTVHALPHNMA